MKIKNQKGFTLTELLLAMTVFSAVLIVTTSVFVAINRTYTRGLVRKELSEAAQLLTEAVTKTVRSQGASGVIAECNPVPSGYHKSRLIGDNVYAWKLGADANGGGVWLGYGSCDVKLSQFIDSRFKLRELNVTPINTAATDLKLYQIQGVMTAGEDDAFVINPSTVDNLYSNNDMRCKGTAQVATTRNCAVEKFSFIVNGRVQ